MAKSAFIAVIGRPSAGKSTLVNALCGYKVSIVSPVPQTTRNTIRGIYSGERGQLVFVDTPGFHDSAKKLNLKLRDLVKVALDDCDGVLYVVDPSRPFGDEEKAILSILSKVQVPVLLGFNKLDLLLEHGRKRKEGGEMVSEVRAAAGTLVPEARILQFSALKGQGLEELRTALYDCAPDGDAWYPSDFYTDQDPEFRISEVIREQIMNRTKEEVPHAAYIEIEDLELTDRQGNPVPRPTLNDWRGREEEELDDEVGGEDDEEEEEDPGETMPPIPADMLAASGIDPDQPLPADWNPQDLWDLVPAQRPKLWIRAHICVERDSQKGILIGKGGSLIKTIRHEATKELRELFPYRIELDLRVKVSPKWRQSDRVLGRIVH